MAGPNVGAILTRSAGGGRKTLRYCSAKNHRWASLRDAKGLQRKAILGQSEAVARPAGRAKNRFDWRCAGGCERMASTRGKDHLALLVRLPEMLVVVRPDGGPRPCEDPRDRPTGRRKDSLG